MSELIGGWRKLVDQPLPMTFQTEGDALVVQPRGELDCGTSDSLPGLVIAAVHDESAVIVDLRRISFIDAAGLRALLICEARLGRQGIGFRVRNASGEVARLLEITSATHLLEQRG